MTPEEFRAALQELGWTQAEAAEKLGVSSGQPRINAWCQGPDKPRGRVVPPYIAASVKLALELHRKRRPK